jgi:D-alanyl-D-alanine carboxypeptidase/D-alanyl-D-alanine-endopeptidase (penicillin-binding protein 4)
VLLAAPPSGASDRSSLASADGSTSAGVIHGDLFLQATGDPSLTPEGLAELARSLRGAGIERIEGTVRLDNQLRDIEALTAGREAQSYGTGALILSGDRYAVHVQPGEIGQNAGVWIGPRMPYFVLHNLVRTVRGKRSRIVVDHSRRDDQLIVTVRGRIGINSRPVNVRKRLADSSAWAATTLAQALSDFGITVRGGVHVGPPPAGPLSIVAEHASEPLSRICHVINKDSNNFVADSLFKTLGAARFGLPGTLEKGARAVTDWLMPLGFKPERVHLVNGSGLTHANRLRPADLGQLLYKLYHSLELGPEFVQSLAVGGIDGTIHHRFHGGLTGFVRGKTGTLSGVSVLSGYVGDQPGVMIFCIFVEGFRGRRLAAVRQAQSRIVEAVMRFVRDGHPHQPVISQPVLPEVPPPSAEPPSDSPGNDDDDGDGEA